MLTCDPGVTPAVKMRHNRLDVMKRPLMLNQDSARGAPDVFLARRAAKIDALPAVAWNGLTLRSMRCVGGAHPHVVYVPEGYLWSLVSLDGHFTCLCEWERP